MKKTLAFLLTMLIVLSMTGGIVAQAAEGNSSHPDFIWYEDFNGQIDTSRPSTANSDERYGTVNIAEFAAPTELQPINHLDMGKKHVINEVYEQLLQKNGHDYLPMLAKEWEQIDDTTYQFTLYDYITDTDGNNITAEDVVFSYELEANGGFAANFQLYESAEAIDTYTVQIHLNAPIDDLVSFEALFSMVDIVSAKAYAEHDFNTDPVATGPYKVESFVTGNNLTLVVNEDYWQTDESCLLPSQRRNCERISIDIISDSSLRLLAVEEGTTMYYENLGSDDIPSFMSDGQYGGEFQVVEKPDSTLYDIIPNITENSPMSDPNLRMAVWYAIDSTQYVLAQNELLTRAATVPAIPSYDDWNEDWESWETYMSTYDLDKSKEYLDKSSYNGETLSIIYEDMPGKMLVAEILQLQLEAAGISAELNLMAHPLYLEACGNPTGFDLAVLSGGTADYIISRIKSFYYDPDGYCGAIYAGDTQFQEMITKCATQSGYSEELTDELVHYIVDNGYSYACTYGSTVSIYSPDFAGLFFEDGDGDIFPGACDYYLD